MSEKRSPTPSFHTGPSGCSIPVVICTGLAPEGIGDWAKTVSNDVAKASPAKQATEAVLMKVKILLRIEVKELFYNR
jgi:hypothetical protein